MGSSINENDLIELEKSLYKTKLKYPRFYNVVFTINIILLLVFLYLFHYIL
jgi:hypothetical protein